MTPAPGQPGALARWWPHLRWLVWLAATTPALIQLGLLVSAIAGRLTYPYDLEWMEGGLLQHAYRIGEGHGIYVEPSIEFIPYLYTPLYPGLLAALGKVFGLGYTLGRVVSVLALIGIVAIAARSLVFTGHRRRRRGPRGAARRGDEGAARPVALAGLIAGLGLFAAAYPYMDGWYDLVRADTLALAMITGGLVLAGGVHHGAGWRGDARAAAAAATLALAFFAKQTAVLYVAWGGLIVVAVHAPMLAARWRDGRAWGLAARRGVTYGVVAGAIGLGGTALLQRTTGGWFWTYVYQVHQDHDFNMDRFWRSFDNILMHFRPMTALALIGLLVVVGHALVRRRLLPGGGAMLLWAGTFALSTLLGAIGWGTEFAHFNAYMPAFLHGALAAAAAVAVSWQLGRRISARAAARATRVLVPALLAGAALAGLGASAWAWRWKPAHFTPRPADRAGGDALIAQLRGVGGEVWAPSHPWYLHLAGKEMYVHRMGIKDVTARKPRPVRGFPDAIRAQRFAGLLLDERDLHLEWPLITSLYRPEVGIAPAQRPRLYSGAKVRPEALWVPAVPATVPLGVKVIADFEGGRFADGWQPQGAAWGRAPADRERAGQGLVRGFGGRWFTTSMHGGDAATGTLASPPFTLTGRRLTARLCGGTDAGALRLELWVGGGIVATAAAPGSPGEQFTEVAIDVTPWRGQEARVILVDQATGSWGHLSVDEIWLWP
ncbi:MAG: hypothetical protein KBG28_03935 [Kofleriaceae bacterium]|nr:hypothetical protein [Kofleriaceae bacterium]